MDREEERNDFGSIKIHKNVIASIASLAAMEIDGVKRVGGGLKNNLFEFISGKATSAIKVEIDKNEEVKIDLPVVIKYEYNIPDVSGKIQENIRSSLERMTSLAIKEININVQGVERP